MSNVETPPTPTPEATPPPAPAPDPVDMAGWKARAEAAEDRHRTEVADRIKERNLYKPAQRLLADLDEASRDELIRLADMARAGDGDGIVEWSLQTVQAVSGKDAAQLIADRQKAQGLTGDKPAPAGDAPAIVPGMTPEQVQTVVREQLAEQARLEQGRKAVTDQMKAAGYDVDSAAGQTIIGYGWANKADIPTSVAWFENDVAATMSARQRAAATAATQVPGTAPAGSPPGTIPDGKRTGESDAEFMRRNAMARLTADKNLTS